MSNPSNTPIIPDPTGNNIPPSGAVAGSTTTNLRVTVAGSSHKFKWQYKAANGQWFNLNGSGISNTGTNNTSVSVMVTQEALSRNGEGGVQVQIGRSTPVQFTSPSVTQVWELRPGDSSWYDYFMKASGVAGTDDPTYYLKKTK